MPCYITLLMTIPVLIGRVIVIIGEISMGGYLVLLGLLVNFVSGFRLKVMYISPRESISSSLTHLHGFQLLVLLP